MIERPDYHSLQQALQKTDADMTAAECHGSLCGIYCASGKIELENWLQQIFEELDLNNVLIKEASQLLVGLFQNTQQQLNDTEADFQLLLPDDEDSLDNRTEALADWCHGFTYGLAMGGLKEDRELPEDTAEIIRDMTEIARAGFDSSEITEADEEAFMHIHEYVRMGVLLITEELQPVPQPQNTLH
ncbi:MAG: UPF0149 family protein [Gammaproteobacteria bacterium]|nr:UPF0149 family protein [Gammaproteobacteria bacterium]